jgi:glycosyltransferase involved in cell wall biosynthesis
MRILVCSLEAPLPPPNGLRVQVSALVGELQKEHEVRVLALQMPEQEAPADSDRMRLIRWSGSAARQLRTPFMEEMERFQPQVVHVTSGRLARLGRQLGDRPSVLAALDAWHLNTLAEARASRGIASMLRRYQALLVRRFEREEYRRFDRVVVVSEEDRKALLEVAPELTIEVIANGVDANAFGWDGTPRDPGVILFTGVMSYAPNVTAAEFLARTVMPRVRRAVPGARLLLVGREPSPAVRALEALPGVEVVGEVPDLRPWLSRAGAYACPMLTGTGIKNKLLEAMANGLPCVATPLALQGIAAKPGEVMVGSTEGELADHLARLLIEPGLADRVGAAGHAYVRANHTWASMAKEFERVYREVSSIHGNRARS